MTWLGNGLTDALALVGEDERIIYANDRWADLIDPPDARGPVTLTDLLGRLSLRDDAPAVACDRLLALWRRGDPGDNVVLASSAGEPIVVRFVPRIVTGGRKVLSALIAAVPESGEKPPPGGTTSSILLADSLSDALDGLKSSIEALGQSWNVRDGALVAEEIAGLGDDTDLIRRAAAALHGVLRLALGEEDVRTAPVDVSDLLMAIMPQWKPRAPRHSFELALAGETPRVSAVEQLVTLALDGLLEVATAWTPQGGVIRVTVRSSQDGVSVAVRPYTAGWYIGPRSVDPRSVDSGSGAAFDAPASNARLRAAMGMAIARTVLEAHGGRLATEHGRTGDPATLLATWSRAGPQRRGVGERRESVGPSVPKPLGPLPRAGRQVVLVWDPDPRMVRYVRANLESQGFHAVAAGSLAEVAQLVELEEPDAMLLHVDDAIEPARTILAELRALTSAPVLLLARRHDGDQCAAMLNAGATDYVSKPFNMDELLARLRVALRASPRSEDDRQSERVVRTGDLCIDLTQRLVSVGEREVRLSKTEFKLLRVLAQHIGTVLAHDMLLARVWGAGYTQESDFLWVYVRRLRRKIEPDPAHPCYVLTVPGVGYRLARLDSNPS